MRYFEARKARIEIIPMIDIMLFLLVFFAMLTLRMIPATGQSFKLPGSRTANALAAPKLLVEIKVGGQLIADGQPVTAERISDLVRSREPTRLSVTIAGSEEATLQQVMTVIDAVRTGGANQIGLAARQLPR